MQLKCILMILCLFLIYLCLIYDYNLTKTHRNISNRVFYIFRNLSKQNQIDKTHIPFKIKLECI